MVFTFIVVFLFNIIVVNNEKQGKDNIILDKIDEYTVLAENSENSGDLDKALHYSREVINNMTAKEILEYHEEIWNMLSITLNYEDGRKLAIDTYEKILNDEKKLDKEKKLFLNNRLIPLYGVNNQYAKALKASMNGIDLANDLGDNYSKGKILIDMSNTFRALGRYELAKSSIEEALNIDIEDESDKAHIKIYGLINLAEISCILDRNDETLNYTSQIDDYIKSMKDKDIVDDYEIIKNIALAQTYINIGKYDKSKYYLEEAKDLFEHDNIVYLIDKDIFYMVTYSNLKSQEGKYYEAIDTCEKALNISRERNNVEYLFTNLKNLKDLYSKVEDQKKLESCNNELIDLLHSERKLINEDYIEFAVNQYENEKTEIEGFRRGILHSIVIVTSTIISIIVFIYIIRLIYINKRDHMTRIYNRRYFDKIYKRLINTNSEFYIIILDIDNFKKINDTYGHDFGDEVLIQVCKNIKNILSKSDRLFRYGGEEFVIISKNKQKSNVINLAESVRKSIEDIKWNKDTTVTISIGISDSSKDGVDLLKIADKNLYISKMTGKNKVTIS